MDELKKLLGSDKLIIGKDRTLKALKTNKLSKIFLASNADPKFVSDIEHYRKMSEVTIEKLNLTNEEIGAVCRKPFLISVLGVLK